MHTFVLFVRSPLFPDELIKSYRSNIRTLADVFVETVMCYMCYE
jgi:hypothetical protein